ncbi:PREDICTED: indole glucosinolate O-methyltransferase 1-like [Camelina sativa]|uniref:Indole glucosinolate O-methyltransferase 1-like n=1 Tax=Camelina sativa TaxID=90675 RepID=A0ABM1R9E6_CAMSA|nr:PREDICTED: indole glucosinolate O-methyltransferase 1-like [Camelina sativa]
MSTHFQAPITINPKPNPTKGEQEAEEEASLLARRLSNGASLPMVLKAALELGVIDTMVTVGDSLWLSPSEIAQRLPIKPSNPEAPVLLDRMLRFLASYLVFKCRSIVAEENGQTGKVERVTHLKDLILEGKDAFSSAHGMKLFEYIETNEGFGKVFNRAMLESSTMVMEKVLRDYEGFTDVKTLVDVGGGLGSTLVLITSKYPHLVGINFDLAVVLANAPSYPGMNHVII